MGTASDERAEHAEHAPEPTHVDFHTPPEPTLAGLAAIAARLAQLRGEVASVADTTEEIHTLLDRQERADTEAEIIAHAHDHHWPVARCGPPCGFIATAAAIIDGSSVGSTAPVAELLKAHTCANETEPALPSNTRLVVGCLTFLAMLIIIAWVIEDLAGVR